MKSVYVLFLVAAAVGATDNKDVDVDKKLADLDTFQKIADCFVDKGPCDEAAEAYKKDVDDTVLYACGKCTPEMRHTAKVFLDAYHKVPEAFEEFKNKYDPERKYIEKLEAAVADA